MLLCAGDGDPTVFYFNTELMQTYWTSIAPSSEVTYLDVDSSAASGDPYADEKNGFAAAKTAVAAAAVVGGASDGGALAVLHAYHAGLVPPFCLSRGEIVLRRPLRELPAGRWTGYICGAQEEHHPAALTALPGKIWQGPAGAPVCPW